MEMYCILAIKLLLVIVPGQILDIQVTTIQYYTIVYYTTHMHTRPIVTNQIKEYIMSKFPAMKGSGTNQSDPFTELLLCSTVGKQQCYLFAGIVRQREGERERKTERQKDREKERVGIQYLYSYLQPERLMGECIPTPFQSSMIHIINNYCFFSLTNKSRMKS